MKIVLSGGSGLIGGCLSRVFVEKGHTVSHLRRWNSNNQTHKKDFTSEKNIFWSNPEVLENADVVIHLAGANVAKPWTQSYKRNILNSRTVGSKSLMEACSACINPPKHIISASGIGYYPEWVPQTLTEESEAGQGFLADVCKQWEEALSGNNPKQIPVSIVRTGLVLSNKSKIVGAAQAQFLQCGMVGSVGSHSNRWSWIHIEDLCHLYLALAEQRLQSGIYNGVAPNPCTQGEFGDAFERFPAIKIPLWLPVMRFQFFLAKKINGTIRSWGIRKRPIVPEWLIKLAWGERAVIALTNQFVSAQKTLDQGFCYQYPTIEKAMQHLQSHPEI